MKLVNRYLKTEFQMTYVSPVTSGINSDQPSNGGNVIIAAKNQIIVKDMVDILVPMKLDLAG